jgi:hypothetical protein
MHNLRDPEVVVGPGLRTSCYTLIRIRSEIQVLIRHGPIEKCGKGFSEASELQVREAGEGKEKEARREGEEKEK